MTATIFPALCRGCGLAPAQASRSRRYGKWYLRLCRECATQRVRNCRARVRREEALWRQRIDNEWRVG